MERDPAPLTALGNAVRRMQTWMLDLAERNIAIALGAYDPGAVARRAGRVG